MNIETLYYKLTGVENPRHLNMRERMIIAQCLEIINETEQFHKPNIPNTPTEPLPAEGSDTVAARGDSE